MMKRLLTFAILAFAPLASAQNAALMPMPRLTFLDSNGVPLVGGYLYTCVAGTSCTPALPGRPAVNPLATYTDSSAGVANSNPIVLDAAGRANVWLGSGNYKIVAQDQFGVTQWSQDNVSSFSLKSVTTSSGAVSNFSVPGTLTAGAATISGATTAQSVNGVLNVAQFAGADLGAKITAALAACPSTGCTIQIPVGAGGNISSPVIVAKQNVKIACDGSYNVHLTQNFAGATYQTGSLFWLQAANNFELTGCYVDTNQKNSIVTTNSDNGMIYAMNTNFAHIHHNYFHDGTTAPHSGTQNGVRFIGGVTVNGVGPSCSPVSITCLQTYITGSYNEVDHNVFDTIPWMATSAGENGGYNDFHDNAFYTVGEAFDFNGNNVDSPANRFHHNTVIGLGTQCFLESVSGSQIDNNYFLTTTDTGAIWVHTAITTIQSKSKITNNIFVGSAAVLHPAVWVFANSQDIDISGNQVFGYGGDGLSISGQGGTVQRITVRENSVFAGTSGSGFCGLRYANGGTSNPVVDSWVQGNTLYGSNSAGYGICSDSTAPTHAVIFANSASINFPSGCTSCTISANEEANGTANTQSAANFASSLQGTHVTGNGTTPTIAAGANAGTSPGLSIQGNDVDGNVALTTGTGTPSAAGTIWTITFTKPYTSNVFCQVTPSGQFLFSFGFVSNPSLSTFALKSNGGAALTASTAYSWTYHCGGN